MNMPDSEDPRAGFSIVEVVIALVVLTIAVLGMVRMQTGAMQAGTSGVQATLVQVQALDMGERIWMDLSDPLGRVDDWRSAHEESLPEWSGDVAAEPSDPQLIRIRIEWDAPAADGGRQRHDHFVRVPRVAP